MGWREETRTPRSRPRRHHLGEHGGHDAQGHGDEDGVVRVEVGDVGEAAEAPAGGGQGDHRRVDDVDAVADAAGEALEPAAHVAGAAHQQHAAAGGRAHLRGHLVLALDGAAHHGAEDRLHHLLGDAAGVGVAAGAAQHPVVDLGHEDRSLLGGLQASDGGGEVHAAVEQLEQGAVDLGDGFAQLDELCARLRPRVVRSGVVRRVSHGAFPSRSPARRGRWRGSRRSRRRPGP
jgi:hypothetical protein